MGLTAEVLSKEFQITREAQDQYALLSHKRAVEATKKGILQQEILPIPLPPGYKEVMKIDSGPRENQSMGALRKLPPYFDRQNGTVTVGNSCPITDGAAAVIVMKEKKAKEMGLEPLGYLKEYAYAFWNLNEWDSDRFMQPRYL